jgi:hypothetical protein
VVSTAVRGCEEGGFAHWLALHKPPCWVPTTKRFTKGEPGWTSDTSKSSPARSARRHLVVASRAGSRPSSRAALARGSRRKTSWQTRRSDRAACSAIAKGRCGIRTRADVACVLTLVVPPRGSAARASAPVLKRPLVNAWGERRLSHAPLTPSAPVTSVPQNTDVPDSGGVRR